MFVSTQLLALALVATSSGDGPQWGGFRGNNGVGRSPSTGLPEVMDMEKSGVWRTEVPGGYSSPVVAGPFVFVTAAEGTDLLTLCIDRGSGDIVWRKQVEFSGERTGANSPAAPTPVTDGERVYVAFHDVGLIAYDLRGEELWRKEIGPFNIPHGYSTSPLVHGDLVVLLVDQDLDAYLIAWDKKTGEEKWKVERPGVTHSYSTPAIYQPEDGPAQVLVSGSLQTASYSLENGERLWWFDGTAWMTKAIPVLAGNVCFVSAYSPSTTEFGLPKFNGTFADALAEHDANEDGKIGRDEWEHQMMQMIWFILDLNGDDILDEQDWDYMLTMQRTTGGLFAIELGGEGNVTESHLKWKFQDRRGLPDASTPLVVDDTLFMIKEGGLFTSVDTESGEVVKQGRVGEPDQYYASPVAADGKIITASLSGQLAVLSAEREWEVVSVHSLDEEVWSTPAIADGQVFVRSQSALYCFQNLSAE